MVESPGDKLPVSTFLDCNDITYRLLGH
ncbi:MAG: hypothetical protein KBT28_01660 [Bacteroidales bacterium]|nr:hypothetical protein [Candidatus Colimorpha merdihippi]